jgi:hypothetical protein
LADHKAELASVQRELEVARTQAANLLAKARAEANAAGKLKAKWEKKLAAFESAGSGSELMTAVSFQMFRNPTTSAGGGDMNMGSVTVGTNAPSLGDFEFRFNVLDQNSKNLNDLDIIRALRSMIVFLETGGGATGGNPYTSVTQQPSGPPN